MAATGGLCRELGGESAGELSLRLKGMITPLAYMGDRRGRIGGISSKSREILALGQNPHQLVSGQWVGLCILMSSGISGQTDLASQVFHSLRLQEGSNGGGATICVDAACLAECGDRREMVAIGGLVENWAENRGQSRASRGISSKSCENSS